MHGSPEDADYRNARISYRITATGPAKVKFPVINFSVESASQKFFERRFAPPAGTSSLESGQPVERTVSLDPTSDAEGTAAYKKTDKAKFTWSIDGELGGEVEMPLHKSWP
jgi:hypothetical protein